MNTTQITLLKSLGIISVVMGHKYFPFALFYHPYSFHMPLFIFISGYLYKEKNEKNKLLYIKRKFKSHILTYYKWNLFYAIVTMIIYLSLNIKLGSIPNLKNFFIAPIMAGDQYHLFIASWFLLQLAIIQMSFVILFPVIKKFMKKSIVQFVFFTCIMILSTYYSAIIPYDGRPSYLTLILKTLFGLGFFYYGIFFKKVLENRNPYRFSILTVSFLIQINLFGKVGNLPFSYLYSDYSGHIIVPIITSINGIYLCLWISKGLSYFLKRNDILINIGKNSMDIMNHHLLSFFLINLFLYLGGIINLESLNDIYFAYKPDEYGMYYVIFGLIFPILFSKICIILKNYVLNRIIYFKWNKKGDRSFETIS